MLNNSSLLAAVQPSSRTSFPKSILQFLFFSVVAVSGTAFGQTQAPTAKASSLPITAANAVAPAEPQREPMMTQFKKTVVYVETDCLTIAPDGKQTIIPYLGTGFLINHHDDRYPQIGGFNYLLTNRHVALPGSENRQPCRVVDYKVRLNLLTPGADGAVLSPPMSMGAAVSWQLPSDNSVDLAVIPFGADTKKCSFLTFPTSLFLSATQAKENRLVEGDSVVFTGLFVQFLGQMKLEPIVREGKVAMIPDEPVPTTLHELGSVYLIDAHVFGGNSGSPVLVNLAGQRDNGLRAGMDYKLLGLLSGYVQETSELTLQPVASYAGTITANSGIAMVVPAQEILNLLNSPKLLAERAEAAKSYKSPE